MNRELARAVRDRANNRCEYCQLQQFAFPLPFQIDHILAEQHGGATESQNLALACPHCNRYKGPNIAGVDPATAEIVRLYHPRTDQWTDHFRSSGARLEGRTAIGRATVQVLAMNSQDMLRLRAQLIQEGGVLP